MARRKISADDTARNGHLPLAESSSAGARQPDCPHSVLDRRYPPSARQIPIFRGNQGGNRVRGNQLNRGYRSGYLTLGCQHFAVTTTVTARMLQTSWGRRGPGSPALTGDRRHSAQVPSGIAQASSAPPNPSTHCQRRLRSLSNHWLAWKPNHGSLGKSRPVLLRLVSACRSI